MLSVALWLLATTVFLRSKYRADLFTLVTSNHQCFVLDWNHGAIDLLWQSPWPGPALLAWADEPPKPYTPYVIVDGPPHGPYLNEDYEAEQKRFPNGNTTVINKEWHRFSYSSRTDPCVYVANDASMIDLPWEKEPFRNDTSMLKLDQTVRSVSAPVWSLPVAFSLFPAFWLATTGGRRWRQLRRTRRGLCAQCGYDLRETPARCPECGAMHTVDARHRHEWRRAFVSTALIGFFAILLLRWTCQTNGAGLPNGDRSPSKDRGVYMPWKFDPAHNSLLEQAMGDNGQYTVRVDLPTKTWPSADPTDITVLLNGNVIHTWNDLIAFKIHDHIIYGAVEGRAGYGYLGATIFAFDLKNKSELWRSALKDCAPQDAPGSRMAGTFNPYIYSEAVGMDYNGQQLFIWGQEPTGRYLEIKATDTGETIGHHYYEIPSPYEPPKLQAISDNWVECEGVPFELKLVADYPPRERETIDLWTVDWKDGKDGGSNVMTYTYPPGSTRREPLLVKHVFPPGLRSTTILISAFGKGQGTFNLEPFNIHLFPAPPTNVVLKAVSPSEVDVSWTNASHFSPRTLISVSSNSEDGEDVGQQTAEPGEIHSRIVNLIPGTRYWVKLWASSIHDGRDDQSASTPLYSVTTLAEPAK